MILYPNAYFDRVDKITIEFLQKNKLKALILDLDNTLIDYDRNMPDKIAQWIKEMIGQGIRLCILSNTNHKDKVEQVANKFQIPYQTLAKKPLKSGFLKAQKKLNQEPQKIGVVGDQIFTDVMGGNRCKMFTILVDPVGKKDFWYTAWKRGIENKIKDKYKNKYIK